MGQLSILMWITVHYNYNTFTGLESYNFTIFNQKKYVLKNSGEVKILIYPAGFELMMTVL